MASAFATILILVMHSRLVSLSLLAVHPEFKRGLMQRLFGVKSSPIVGKTNV